MTAFAAALTFACSGDGSGPTDPGAGGVEVEVTPGEAVLASIGATEQFSAAATAVDGQDIADANVQWTSSDEGVATVDENGLATSTGAGTATITATVGDAAAEAMLVVDPDAATLAFAAQPTNATAGEPISPAVRVRILDDRGNVVEADTAPITLAIDGDAGGGTLSGTKTVNAEGGVAIFSDLSIEAADAGYTLTASADGMQSATSAAFDIAVGPPVQIAFLEQPSKAEGQAPITPAVEVAIQDEFGNIVTDASAEVTLTLATDTEGATLSGTLTASTTDGVATFTDVRIDRPGSYMLEATVGTLIPAAMSATFHVVLTFTQVSAGVAHTCGLTITDTVYCWGDAYLGDGTTASSSTPVLVTGSTGIARAVSAGADHTCFIGPFDGVETELYCWGDSDLIHGVSMPLTTPEVLKRMSYRAISLGAASLPPVDTLGTRQQHSCWIVRGSGGQCWGYNSFGQLGGGSRTGFVTGMGIDGGHGWASVSVGRIHTCAVTTAGDGYCWGSNGDGRLGDGTTTDRYAPEAIVGGHTFVQASAGGAHTCAVAEGAAAYCWGRNDAGQLGDGTTTSSAAPETVVGGHTFVRVSTGLDHTCAITAGGTAYCWGRNIAGQLGDSIVSSSTPVRVAGDHEFVQVSAGLDHTCAVTSDNAAYCWGGNDHGQLGDGTATDSPTPVRVK